MDNGIKFMCFVISKEVRPLCWIIQDPQPIDLYLEYCLRTVSRATNAHQQFR